MKPASPTTIAVLFGTAIATSTIAAAELIGWLLYPDLPHRAGVLCAVLAPVLFHATRVAVRAAR
jgi:hypothetical protein